ncbi:hypothetical protein BRD01_13575 [Halobacteriales archaeon QS_8_65_32]|nr:MAG: hypothetical protein BRD01_13575 [Halobacteriales archaeon QS_8_65_32]
MAVDTLASFAVEAGSLGARRLGEQRLLATASGAELTSHEPVAYQYANARGDRAGEAVLPVAELRRLSYRGQLSNRDYGVPRRSIGVLRL